MRKKSKILYVHHAGGYGGAPKSMGYIIKNLNLDLYHPVLLNISQGPINDFFSKEVGCELIIDSKFMRPFHGSYVVENSISIFLRNWIFFNTDCA
ncbi:hypothetical protein BV902_02225 [Sphingobacterium sp. B29]|nr:hypothetical protein BV902_02225 [Sphingobacterium sp. B29]